MPNHLPTHVVDVTFFAWLDRAGGRANPVAWALARTAAQIGPPMDPGYIPPPWRNQGPPAPVIHGPPAPEAAGESPPAETAPRKSEWELAVLKGRQAVMRRLGTAYGIRTMDRRLQADLWWAWTFCHKDGRAWNVRKVDEIMRSQTGRYTVAPDPAIKASREFVEALEAMTSGPFAAVTYHTQMRLGRSHKESLAKAKLAQQLFDQGTAIRGLGPPNYRRGEYNERFAPTPGPLPASPTHQPVR